MKIVSWNVNGLRALHRKGNFEWLLKKSPDIFCLQEVKATPEQLPEDVRNPKGYSAFFDFPKEKKGYSGVATYSKVQPDLVEYIMGIPELDKEGRLVTTYFGDIALMNAYFPNGGGGPERLKYKLNFYDEFLRYIEKVRKNGSVLFFAVI